MPANPNYHHNPMAPVSGHAVSLGPQTTPLNVGTQVNASAATIEYITVYITNPAGQTYGLARLFGAAIYQLPFEAYPGIGTAPASNNSGISAPTAAPTAGVQTSTPSYPAGTYQISYTYTTALGESSLSPSTSIVMDGTETPTFTNPTAYPSLASTGYVTVELIVPRLENWHVTRYAILAQSPMSMPSASIYIDSITPVNLLDTTALGAQNSANSDIYLRPGQIVYCQWLYVDPNALVTLSLFGEKTTGMR